MQGAGFLLITYCFAPVNTLLMSNLIRKISGKFFKNILVVHWDRLIVQNRSDRGRSRAPKRGRKRRRPRLRRPGTLGPQELETPSTWRNGFWLGESLLLSYMIGVRTQTLFWGKLHERGKWKKFLQSRKLWLFQRFLTNPITRNDFVDLRKTPRGTKEVRKTRRMPRTAIGHN